MLFIKVVNAFWLNNAKVVFLVHKTNHVAPVGVRKNNFFGFFWSKCLYIKKKYYLCTAKRKSNCARPTAQVAELVDAHVSGACAARCAGSSPALGTNKESLTVE